MNRLKYVLAGAAALGAALASGSASAMPNGLSSDALASNVEQVRWVCGPGLLVAAQLLLRLLRVGTAVAAPAPLVISAFAGGPSASLVALVDVRGGLAGGAPRDRRLDRRRQRRRVESGRDPFRRRRRRASCAATACDRWSGSTPPSPRAAFPARARRPRRG